MKNKETELKKIGHRLAEAEAFKEVIAEKVSMSIRSREVTQIFILIQLKSEQSTHFNLKERYELLKDSFEEQKQELEKKVGLNRYYSMPHCSRELFRVCRSRTSIQLIKHYNKLRLKTQHW